MLPYQTIPHGVHAERNQLWLVSLKNKDENICICSLRKLLVIDESKDIFYKKTIKTIFDAKATAKRWGVEEDLLFISF